jgi:hypothetical protein
MQRELAGRVWSCAYVRLNRGLREATLEYLSEVGSGCAPGCLYWLELPAHAVSRRAPGHCCLRCTDRLLLLYYHRLQAELANS